MADDDSKPDGKRPGDWHDTLPFPRRWIAYVAIKVIVLVFVAWLALRWQGLV